MPARWFAPTGRCRCGKPATGRLMSERNADLGTYCEPCAKKEIAKADREYKRAHRPAEGRQEEGV